MSSVFIKTEQELVQMRKACRLAAQTLEEAAKMLKPGITTDEINTFVHNYTLDNNATPAPLGYRGYPKSVCTSVNEVICHGIPGNRILVDGDIINVDVTTILDGWHGDVSASFFIGEPSTEARRIVEVSHRCLELGMSEVKHGARLGDVGAAIQDYAESNGYSVVRDFVGHGIGKSFHEAPQVAHFGVRGRGPRLKNGMTFTIEPMINQGVWQMETLDDGWTAITADRKLSAQFEHTIVVTNDGFEVLTAFSAPLPHSV